MSVYRRVQLRGGVGTSTEHQKPLSKELSDNSTQNVSLALWPASGLNADKVALRVWPAQTLLPWEVPV